MFISLLSCSLVGEEPFKRPFIGFSDTLIAQEHAAEAEAINYIFTVLV
jgi:hypothetical protein